MDSYIYYVLIVTIAYLLRGALRNSFVILVSFLPQEQFDRIKELMPIVHENSKPSPLEGLLSGLTKPKPKEPKDRNQAHPNFITKEVMGVSKAESVLPESPEDKEPIPA